MFTVLLWAVIFALGLVLYFAPVFLRKYISEGFEATPPEDTTLYLKQLQEILKPQVVGTPNLGSLTKLHEGAATTSSTPATPNTPATNSTVLAQGAAFQKTIPTIDLSGAPVKSILDTTESAKPKSKLDSMNYTQPQIQYIKVPVEKKCPPQRKCPSIPPPKQCPDMSQYIRKDSIPCWSCKLG
jgi:hypothetical protein